MPIKIEIPDSQVTRAKEFYTSLAKEVLERLNSAKKEWDDLQPTLQQLDIRINSHSFKRSPTIVGNSIGASIGVISVSSKNGYDKNWSWGRKAAYVIEKKKRALSAKEILDMLISEYEPTINKAIAANSVPSTLSVAARDGRFNRSARKDGEYEYSLIEE